MLKILETVAFSRWFRKLKDKRAKARIAERVQRLRSGNPGDVEPVGDGISELRIHYGPGYRVYFVKEGKEIIVLLCGGDKATQDEDIKRAKKLAKEPKELKEWQ